MNDDANLRDRLARMESRVPASPPPAVAADRRHHVRLSLASAAVLVLVLAATAAAGAMVVSTLTASAFEGIQNPGQPLAAYHMECMTPPQAAAFLAEHGYTDVVWQVESGTPKVDGKTTQTTVAPEHGYVIPGAILDDGKLHMVVDQRTGAEGVGTCHGMPMP